MSRVIVHLESASQSYILPKIHANRVFVHLPNEFWSNATELQVETALSEIFTSSTSDIRVLLPSASNEFGVGAPDATMYLGTKESDIERINVGLEKDKMSEMKLENVQLPQEESNLFGDEGEQEEAPDADLAGGGEAAGEEAGGEEAGGGGLEGLFAGDYIEGDVLGEEDGIEEKYRIIKPTNKISKRSGKNGDKRNTVGIKKMKSSPNSSGINVRRLADTGLTGIGSAYNLGSIKAPKAPSLSLKDSIMPQSSVINDYVDNKIKTRKKLDKQTSDMLANLNKTLGYNKKGMLNEDIDLDEDILIDVIEKEEDSE